ncbi:hypothetical protein OG204_24330 [Streptomyces sp. NBC_01387]|uniref:hypothetical protein n=1 Tax=unclassified Streptomyces TaxID=2593676 RepID=UPI002E32CD3E|nr:hypothetical protein [Streptomyces sp. NBC_01267]
MPVTRKWARRWIVGALSLALSLTVQPAFAGGSRGAGGATESDPTEPSGPKDTLYATAIHFDESNNGSNKSATPMTSVSNWTPPACWYEPKWSPAEFKDEFQRRWDIPHASGVGEAHSLDQDHYIKGKPYKDFNKSETGKGMWWDAVRDKKREEAGDPAAFECDTATFWVKNGVTPKVKNAVTPEILSQLAYNKIKVPDTKVTLAPADATKVNLPTWAWLDKVEFKSVSVTAALNAGGLNIQATTTATPVSLRLEPGTDEATTFPASGECPINHGRIGEPYANGKADVTPPCGVEYLRSSGDGTYKLRATVTWEIHWIGTGVSKEQSLPDGEFGATQDVTVQEIQAINR